MEEVRIRNEPLSASLARLWMIFHRPLKVFADVSKHKDWQTPFVTVFIVEVLYLSLVGVILGWYEGELITKLILVAFFGAATIALLHAVLWLISSFIVLTISYMIARIGDFRRLLYVTIWLWIPDSVRLVYESLYIAVTGSELESMRTLSLGVMFPATSIASLTLESLSVFVLWSFYLLYLGLCYGVKISKLRSIIISVILLVLLEATNLLMAILNPDYSGVLQSL